MEKVKKSRGKNRSRRRVPPLTYSKDHPVTQFKPKRLNATDEELIAALVPPPKKTKIDRVVCAFERGVKGVLRQTGESQVVPAIEVLLERQCAAYASSLQNPSKRTTAAQRLTHDGIVLMEEIFKELKSTGEELTAEKEKRSTLGESLAAEQEKTSKLEESLAAEREKTANLQESLSRNEQVMKSGDDANAKLPRFAFSEAVTGGEAAPDTEKGLREENTSLTLSLEGRPARRRTREGEKRRLRFGLIASAALIEIWAY